MTQNDPTLHPRQTVRTEAMGRPSVTALLLLALVGVSPARTQQPSPTVTVSWGIDTTDADSRAIVALVRAYLAKPDSSARTRGLWSAATEFDRRVGDLTIAMGTYQGFPSTIVGITSHGSGDSVYTVKVIYAEADSTRTRISPLALQRLYAVREPGARFGFKLAGTLPRLTSHWERRSNGRMTFWYAPGQRPNNDRISRSTRFVDSVATLFQVQAPPHLDVYVTADMDEAERALGLDFFPRAGPDRGGAALPFNIVLAGDPALGEAYLHEFVHAVLGAAFPSNNGLFNEGVATWLGGSQGRTTRQLYAQLRQYQELNPALTIADLLRGGSHDVDARAWTDAHRATGALVAETIYRKEGIRGLRAFALLKRDPDTLVASLRALLGLAASDPAALDRWWRNEARRVSQSH